MVETAVKKQRKKEMAFHSEGISILYPSYNTRHHQRGFQRKWI
jgi:hypothetical protein